MNQFIILYMALIFELVEYSICNDNRFRLSTLQHLCKIDFVEYSIINVYRFRLSTLQMVYFPQRRVLYNVQIEFLKSHEFFSETRPFLSTFCKKCNFNFENSK